MFGRKKKNTSPTVVEDTDGLKSRFKIHTMQDDLKAASEGAVMGKEMDVEIAASKITRQKKEEEKSQQAAADSPFLNTSTDQSTNPEAQKDTSLENPFFSAGASVAVQTPPPPPGPAPEPVITPIESPTQKEPITPPTPPVSPVSATVQNIEPTEGIKLSKEIKIDDSPPKINAKTSIESEVAAIASKGKDIFENSPTISESFGLPQNEQVTEINAGAGLSDSEVTLSAAPETGGGAKKMFIVIASVVLIILLIVAGLVGWYWWTNKGAKNNQLEQDVLVDQSESSEGQDSTPIVDGEDGAEDQSETEANPRYAIEYPNYIEITDGTTAVSEFTAKIGEIATNLPEQDISTPISFLVTDAAGTPLSFRSFAFLTDMDLPENVLTASGDGFEVYAIPDGNQVRFGIGFDVRSDQQEVMRAGMREAEPTLSATFTNLYNSLTPQLTETIYGDNVYGDHTVRFTNLTEDETLSIDYTVTEARVFVGTTKESQRIILDQYAQKVETEEEILNINGDAGGIEQTDN